MSGFINNEGYSAGPIRISDIKNNDQFTWITQVGDDLLFTDKRFTRGGAGTDESDYSYKMLRAGSPPDDCTLDSAVVTIGYLANKLGFEINGTNPGTKYAKQDSVDRINYVLYRQTSNMPTYTSTDGLIRRVEKLESKDEALTEKVEKLEEDFEIFNEEYNELENEFNNYKGNPFPQGVIFVAGGA